MTRIEEIRERERKATKGPWKSWADRQQDITDEWSCLFHIEATDRCPSRLATLNEDMDNAEGDADFIANARDDVPFLLAEVERLKKVCRFGERMSELDIQRWKDAEAERDKLRAENARLSARMEAAEAALEVVEWVDDGDAKELHQCPICQAFRGDPHKEDCLIGKWRKLKDTTP